MKKTILTLLLLLSIVVLFNSCSSEKSDTESDENSKLIIGKWAWTNQTLPSKCASYREFKSDGTLTYYQNVCGTPEIDYLIYKMDGSTLTTQNASNSKEKNIETETIIELTKTTMKTSSKSGSQTAVQYISYVKIE